MSGGVSCLSWDFVKKTEQTIPVVRVVLDPSAPTLSVSVVASGLLGGDRKRVDT